jgi:hypothetical protein
LQEAASNPENTYRKPPLILKNIKQQPVTCFHPDGFFLPASDDE